MKKAFTTSTLAVALLLLAGSCNKDIESQDADRAVKELKSGNATVFVQTVQLSGDEEVPSVMTTAKGIAILRITADMKLHSKVIVNNVEDNDQLTAAHIHRGAKGSNGGVLLFLVHSADDFGQNKVRQLTQAQYDELMNPDLHFYVNAHSANHPSGIVRGQIR